MDICESGFGVLAQEFRWESASGVSQVLVNALVSITWNSSRIVGDTKAIAGCDWPCGKLVVLG